MDARATEPASRLPCAAAHPIRGGMAPTTAPTHVLLMLICSAQCFLRQVSCFTSLISPTARSVRYRIEETTTKNVGMSFGADHTERSLALTGKIHSPPSTVYIRRHRDRCWRRPVPRSPCWSAERASALIPSMHNQSRDRLQCQETCILTPAPAHNEQHTRHMVPIWRTCQKREATPRPPVTAANASA